MEDDDQAVRSNIIRGRIRHPRKPTSGDRHTSTKGRSRIVVTLVTVFEILSIFGTAKATRTADNVLISYPVSNVHDGVTRKNRYHILIICIFVGAESTEFYFYSFT